MRDEKCTQTFSLKSEGKRLLGRLRHRWENNFKTDLKEIGCEDVDWIHLTQDMD